MAIGAPDTSPLTRSDIADPLVSPVLRNGDRRAMGAGSTGAGTSDSGTLATLTNPHSPAFALAVILIALVLIRGRIDLAARAAVSR
jgi:hypothetical protein